MKRITLIAGLVGVVSIGALTVAAAGPLDQAISIQQTTTREDPSDPGGWNDLGNLLVLARRPEEAEVAYRRALERDPSHVASRFNLGALLAEAGRREEAAELFDQVLELDPKHASAHYQRARLAELAGKRQRAIDGYATAFRLDPQLTFADRNPHILDSKLTLLALLDAYEQAGAPQGTPLLYSDSRRIADLLAPAAEGGVEETRDSRPPNPLEGRDDQPSKETPRSPAESGRGPEKGASRVPSARILGPEAIDGSSQIGQATSDPRQNSSAGSRPFGVPSTSGSTPQAKGSPSTIQRPGYRPGVVSTGRLERTLHLEPERPT